MGITAKQREQRRGFLGASDISAVMGLNPYATAGDVYLSKTQNLTDEKDDSEPIEIGNMLEDVLCRWAAESEGLDVFREVRHVGANGIFAANLDAQAYKVVGDPAEVIACDNIEATDIPATFQLLPIAIEAKTSSLGWQWGDDDDELPIHVVVQAESQIYCGDLDLVHVPALLAKNGRLARRMYQVPRRDDIIENILAYCEPWWEKHVLGGIAPLDTPPRLDNAKRIIVEAGKRIELVDEVVIKVEEWRKYRDERLAYEKAEKAAQAAVILALGDAELGILPDGRAVTRKLTRGGRSLRSEFKTEYPDLFEQFTKQSEYYKLGFKKSA